MKNFKLDGIAHRLSSMPSMAITQCLGDLAMCEKHPSYRVEMRYWHCWDGHEGVCEVCLGGARLARMYGDPRAQFRAVDAKIASMDYFRDAELLDGLKCFWGLNLRKLKAKIGEDTCDKLYMFEKFYIVRPYTPPGDFFREDMHGIVDELHKHGW